MGVLLLLQVGAAVQANAERRTHHPWFSARTQDASNAVITRNEATKQSRLPDRNAEIATAPSGPRDDTSGHKVVQQALRYQGTRYRFGGNSKYKGFDCSGLVMRIYNDLKFGKLPHTSSGLYEMGQPVPMRDLRPGDLVFFKNTYRHGISHVGVFAGKNRFIHAMDHRHGVTVTLLSDPYFQLHYAGARRLY
jgi:cell wall-associated NlpC family hydrolase